MLEIFQYAGIVTVLATSLVGISKDWSTDHAKIRWPMLAFVLLGAGVAVVSTYLTQKESMLEAERLIASEMTTRSVLSEQNSLLLDKVIQLEGKVQSEKLQLELDKTRKELEKTQEALKPPPKARIVFSLRSGDETRFDVDNPIKEITLPIIDGSVNVSLLSMNVSNVYSTEVGIWVQICDACEYAEEPKNFKKPELSTPQIRQKISRVVANKTLPPPIELKIKPPSITTKRIQIAVRVRCKECEPLQNQKFLVNISR